MDAEGQNDLPIWTTVRQAFLCTGCMFQCTSRQLSYILTSEVYAYHLMGKWKNGDMSVELLTRV